MLKRFNKHPGFWVPVFLILQVATGLSILYSQSQSDSFIVPPSSSVHFDVALKIHDQSGSPHAFHSPQLGSLENKIQNTVHQAVDRRWMSAANLLVYQSDFPLIEASAGTSRTTVIPIASLTKSFTAVLVFQLAERGFIKLDQEVQSLGINIPGEKKESPITIRHLLQQTSGISYGGSASVRKPGTTFEYSNTNYRLLARIIEKVTEKSYPEFLKNSLLDPLEMKDTFSSDTFMGHSGISSNVKDLHHFGAALAGGGQWKGVRILRRESLQEMLQPPPFMEIAPDMFYYAHGFRVEVKNGQVLSFYHTGVWNGTLAEVRVFPAEGIHVVQLANPPSYTEKSFQEYRWNALALSNQYVLEYGKTLRLFSQKEPNASSSVQ